jgi:hypothetical protein
MDKGFPSSGIARLELLSDPTMNEAFVLAGEHTMVVAGELGPLSPCASSCLVTLFDAFDLYIVVRLLSVFYSTNK